MTCSEFPTLLHGYMDGELDLVRNVEIEEHLRTCGACSQAYRAQLALRSAAEGVFNLASGVVRTVRSLVEQIGDLIGLGGTLAFGKLQLSSDETMHLEADITHLQQATGWKSRTSVEEGLRETVEWFKANSWRYVERGRDEVRG